MGRKLRRAHPDDPDALRRQRLQIFKLFYQAYYEWEALRSAGLTIEDVLPAPNGEEIYMPDLMTGYHYLPRRQQQSFELICMRSYTEAAATVEIYGSDEGFVTDDDGNPVLDSSDNPIKKKRSSTVVQQYAQQALERMIEAFDQKQNGTWDPLAVMKTRKLNGKVVSHDVAATRRHRLEHGGQGRRDPGQVPGDVYDRSREDGVLHRGSDEAEKRPRGLSHARVR